MRTPCEGNGPADRLLDVREAADSLAHTLFTIVRRACIRPWVGPKETRL